jgi:hypothetical protein
MDYFPCWRERPICMGHRIGPLFLCVVIPLIWRVHHADLCSESVADVLVDGSVWWVLRVCPEHGHTRRGSARCIPASPHIVRGTYARYGVLSRPFRYTRYSWDSYAEVSLTKVVRTYEVIGDMSCAVCARSDVAWWRHVLSWWVRVRTTGFGFLPYERRDLVGSSDSLTYSVGT